MAPVEETKGKSLLESISMGTSIAQAPDYSLVSTIEGESKGMDTLNLKDFEPLSEDPAGITPISHGIRLERKLTRDLEPICPILEEKSENQSPEALFCEEAKIENHREEPFDCLINVQDSETTGTLEGSPEGEEKKGEVQKKKKKKKKVKSKCPAPMPKYAKGNFFSCLN
jgi:hypothetical protein